MISLRCTVIRADRPCEPCDVVVESPAGATAGDLAHALVDAGIADAGTSLTSGGAAIAPTAHLGRRPLVDGAFLVATRTRPCGPPAPRSTLALHVVSGPDAGSILPLSAGTATVGRDVTATLTVADPLLSRQHFAVHLGTDGLVLHDLDSSNGTVVEGSPVTAGGVACPPGTRIQAGATTFAVRTPSSRPVAQGQGGDGVVAVTRGPRTAAPPVAARFRRRPPPEPAHRTSLPWIAMLAPLLLCAPLAWFTHQPTYLLVGLMSPLTMGASQLVERRGRRRRELEQHGAWRADERRVCALVEQAVAADLARRRTASPDPALLLETARLPGHRLWERGSDDSDVLQVALGCGDVPSEVEVLSDDGETRPVLDRAPVVVDLADAGHLGVSGAAEAVDGVLRLAVARLAVQCSPRVVRFVSLDDSGRWTRWLPHHLGRTPSALAQEVRRRLEVDRPSGAPPAPRVVVVAHDVTAWSSDSSFAVLLDDGPRVGVHVVAGARLAQQLPARCGAVLTVADREPSVLTRRDGQRSELVVDAVTQVWAEEVARALAPLRDTTPEPGCLPRRVRLADVCGLDPSSVHDVTAAWGQSRRTTRATIGAGADGPVHVDLVRDGPHALVAGTTGAGKSELLQTIVCSLALGNRPDELAFVLVDYKGGAAFRELADLPHVIGLVTDLDPHLADRALTSLQAELTRRERLLADVGASDFMGYLALRDAGRAPEPLARLVLVVDEFRLLADELPTFLDGLVRLASIGRSLGVHLVLATQRPAGVVTADIKANVNLRICLRVRDKAESDDVVDAPDAALLPVDLPGRAVLRAGSDALVPFQVALTTASARESPPGTVRVRPMGATPDPATHTAAGPLALVRALQEATAACGATPPTSPWLPALPDVVPPPEPTTTRLAATAVPYAVVDRPDQGRREQLVWDAATSSHLAVCGMARTGRSTACIALALAASERLSADDLHVHVIEAAPRLGPALAGLPHLGAAVVSHQAAVVARLVQRLVREPPRAPHTLLLVDGWEAVAESLDTLDHGRTTDELLALLRDGERWGLRAVVTGGRGVLSARLSGVLPERLMLRTADPTDLLLAGAPAPATLTHQPPGRAVHLPSGREVQLVWPGDDVEIRRRVAAVRTHHAERPATTRPLRLRSLPQAIELSPDSERQLTGLEVQVGLGGDDAEAVRLDLSRVPVVAVAGPAGSGKSSTLASWAGQLHRRGVGVLALADAASPLSHGPWPVRDPLTPAQVDWPTDVDCLLVDDADRLPDVVGRRLATWTSAAPPFRALVVATTTDALSASFTDLAAAVRRHRTGVLLQPERTLDGDAFGVVAERPDVRTPGRGLLVVHGRATPVQVAIPPDAARAANRGTPI
ncbi:MAG: FtsK/SpoIIIE domain-containing protein [Angustibacter sp.]